ncbi:DivIVA domain-containing protein [Longispora fulva]|uniref:DivIVA domain-containing protein n=1 Tax=Longispora fulva TaxID=619741 RepID=A0A8J7GJY2_9ACTN|nr:DivIVA domain-containing protein [Longispora fulva]MBG6138187.1 DivIVA domain-containing protein [Longispora fulva]
MTGKKFDVVLRGYDRRQVDVLLARAEERGLTREEVENANLTIVLRGYHCGQVLAYLAGLVEGQ